MCGAEVDLAAENLADGRDDLGHGLALGDKARGPGPQDAAGERLFIVRRIDEDLHGRPARLDVVDQLDAVLAIQRKVDDDDVRVPALDQPQCFLDMLRFTTNLQVGLAADRQGKPLAHDRMVVHDHDSAADQRGGRTAHETPVE